MGVTSDSSGMACCSTLLAANLKSSLNARRLLFVMCWVAATASAHPRKHSLSLSTGFGTFSQKTLSLSGRWFWFTCDLVEWRMFPFIFVWPPSTNISIVFCYNISCVARLWHLNWTLLFFENALTSGILLILVYLLKLVFFLLSFPALFSLFFA